ncbi:MAG: hypothetical protein HKM89_09870, partial [Gemmatimonadales bacterium]|nr:hypothetical protein [Gemmatimonadales bacterium]
PTPAQVEQGQTIKLSATVTDSAGNVVQGQPIVWASSDPAVATVNGSGEVSGLAAGGPVTIAATADTATGIALVTVVHPPPAVLVFSVEPTDVVAGEDLAPWVQVTVADRFGSPVVGDASPITLALGSNPGGATLGGTITVTAQDGIATFSDLTLDRTGVGYTLVASTPGLSSVASTPFAVTPAGAASLIFSVEPSDAQAGTSISPAVTVSVLDGFGNLATADTTSVFVSLGQNPSGGTLSGTTLVAPVNGVATFSDLRLDKTGAGYTLVASRAGLAARTSDPFAILPGPPARLAFTEEPSDATAGTAIAPAIEVTVLDAFDNIVVTDASTVSLSIGANPGGSTLSGVPASTVVGGVARFADIRLDKAGNGYTLVASRTGLPGATSAPFAITAGPPVAVEYRVEPTTAAAGAPITPPVRVAVVDGFGNAVTSSSVPIDIQIASNPGGSTLSGTTRVDAIQGIATFSDLSLNKTGSGYTLRASSSGLASSTSQGFTIVPGQPIRLDFTVQPTDSDPLAVISPPVEVTVLDPFGNVVTGSTIAITVGLALNPGGSILSGTTTQFASNGVAVFDDLSLDKSGNNYLLSAGTPGLIGSLSDFFDIP